MATTYSHSYSIYDAPSILEKIPTVLNWNESELAKCQEIQKHYQKWYSNNASTSPGHFASDYEYWFFRLLQLRGTFANCILLSNVPLQAIAGVDRNAFQKWYTQQNYKPMAFERAFKRYSLLVGAKSVDLIVVQRATGRILGAFEVDGPDHLTDQNKIGWDHAKSYNFKILQIPLLRICTGSVLKLWSLAASEGHDDRFDRALQKMNGNWRCFVTDPSINNMQRHFADPIVASSQPISSKLSSIISEGDSTG